MENKNLSGSTRQRSRATRLPNFIRRFWVAKLFIFALLFTNKVSAQTITVDGNPNDWDSVFAHNPFSTHIHDLVNSGSDDVWTGGSQNTDPISGWHWTNSNTNDKTDIGNAGIALIGHTVYVMADLFATNGDAAIGFWVLKQNVQEVAGGTFSGAHEVGDLLIGIAFSNGGLTATTIVSKWNGTGLDTISLSTSAANAATNTTTVSVPPDWTYVSKSGAPGIYPNTSFFEAFVNLDSVNVTFDPCFSSFTVLTWNSQSIHASLADLTQGIFATKPQVSINNDTVCAGSAAVFTAAVTGGLAPFTYSFNGGAFLSTNTFTVNPATTNGIVTVTVHGSNGCLSEPDTGQLVVKPSPTLDSIPNFTYCNRDAGSAITFTSPTAGTTFAWTGTTNVGFGTSGTGSIGTYTATNSGTAAITTTVTVTPSAGGCQGPSRKFTVTVNPTPTVDSVGNATYCNGDAGAAINFTGGVGGTTFSWTSTANVGFGTSGSTNIAAYTATNTGTAAITATVTVTPSANGCTGAARKFVVTVNPTPHVDSVGNATYCNGDAASAINFSGSVGGTTFSWTSTANVGFGTSGSTNIAAYTATNGGVAAVTATVTVTPSANGCTGPARKFYITVNPTATVDSIGSVSYCNGDAASAINFSGAVGGTTFTWVASANVGFGTSGSTDIAAFTATNTGTAIVTSTVVVTPTGAGCSGTARTFVVTVRPTPHVDSIGNATYCKGASAAGINFNGPVSGTTFTWNGSANVGFGTSGVGSIGTYTATNAGSTPVVDVVTVTPTANGCSGPARTFTVTVNPNPGPNAPVSNALLCNGANNPVIPLTSLDTSAHFSWTSDKNFGVGTSGTDSIPSFTGHNGGTTPDTATITVTSTSGAGCVNPVTTGFLIVVKPSPAANAPVSNINVCQGTVVPSIIFLGLDTTLDYNWKSTANVGFGLTGIDSIHTFTAIGAPMTATVTVTSMSHLGCPGDSTGFTVTVNPVPVVTARDTFTCVGVTVPLKGSPAGGTWTGTGVSGSNFSAASVGTYTVVYHYSNGSCTDSARARVTVTNCGGAFGTYTQGYYGGNGKSCGGPLSAGKYNSPTALITYLLGTDTMYIGRPGREVIIPPTAAAAAVVNAVMPGSSTPNKLTVAANVYISNTAGSVFATNYLTRGRINNVFLSQTIAIKFAARLSGLNTFPIEYNASGASRFETEQVTTSDCKTFTPVPCTGSSNYLAQVVTKYLTKAGTVPATVTDLIALADDLLGGVRTPGETFGGYVVPTYSQVVDAEDALLHAFDGWKFFPGAYNTNVNAGCGGKPIPAAPLTGEFKVYPNPNSGSFNVEVPAITSDATIRVMDINGRVIATQTATANENPQMLQFNLSVSQGMYFVHMISGDSEFATKVLIQ